MSHTGDQITPDNHLRVSAPPPRYSRNFIPLTHSCLKQAPYRPVFSLVKSPDKQTGLIAGFPVTLYQGTPETGRSGSSGNGETGLRTGPDGSFTTKLTDEVTHRQKKGSDPSPVGTVIDAHPKTSRGGYPGSGWIPRQVIIYGPATS